MLRRPAQSSQPSRLDRRDVLAYADAHGPKAAGERYGVPAGTVRSWRHRARERAVRLGLPDPHPSAADRWLAQARQLAERYAKRVCLRCGGAGRVRLEPVHHGSLLVRKAQTIPCPDCGAPVRRIQVNELPRAECVERLAVAGDMGLGWNGREWAMIRAGEPDPDGYRFTAATPRRWPVNGLAEQPELARPGRDRLAAVVRPLKRPTL